MKLKTVFLALLLPIAVFGQAANDYRSAQSGNWNSLATWERFNGATWVTPAPFMPASPSGVITIRSGHTVTFNFDLNVDQLVVDPAGTLTIPSGKTMTLLNGVGTDLASNGSVEVYGTLRSGNGAVDGPTYATTPSTLTFMNGGVYKLSSDAGQVPSAMWNAGSTADFVGPSNTTAAPSGLNQPFHHVIWEFTGRGSKVLNGALTTINGDFTIKTISETSLTLFSPAGGSHLTIGGNLVLASTLGAGNIVTPGAGTGGFAHIEIAGGLLHANGILDLTNATGASTTVSRLSVGGTYQMTGGTLTVTGTGPAKIVLNGSAPQTLSAVGTMANLQKIGLQVDNAMGVTLNSDFAVADTLELTNGAIATGTHFLTLGSSGTTLGKLVLGDGMVIGKFKRWLSSALTSWVFPMGCEGRGKTMTITYTSAPNPSGTLTASFHATDPGSTGLPTSDPPETILHASVDGYWSLVEGDGFGRSSLGTYSLNLQAGGTSGVLDYTTLHLIKRPVAGNWTVDGTHQPATGSNSEPVLHRTGMVGYGEFGIGAGADNPLPVELVSFQGACRDDVVQLQWRTATESNNYGFDIERMTDGTWTWAGFVRGSGTTNAPRCYSFSEPFPGGMISDAEVRYRLVQIDRNGAVHPSAMLSVTRFGGAVSVALDQNYPNPFGAATSSGTSTTAISFRLREPQRVTLSVYNVLGREVARLYDNSMLDPGAHTSHFDATALPGGTYSYELTAGSTRLLRMMHLIR
jgi:hypothetical protein